MPCCAVKGCKSRAKNKENYSEHVSFHRLHSDENLLKIWSIRAGKPREALRRDSTICSQHFTTDAFQCHEDLKWRRLRNNAIPTLNLPSIHNKNILMTTPATPMDVSVGVPSTIEILDGTKTNRCELPARAAPKDVSVSVPSPTVILESLFTSLFQGMFGEIDKKFFVNNCGFYEVLGYLSSCF